MPNIKISDLPPIALPAVGADTFFEVQTVVAGEDVSRKISLDEIVSTTGLDASFLTVSANAQLPNERVLTAGTGVNFIDSGPNGTLTINASGVSFPLLAPAGSAAAPSYAFTDGDSGFFQPLDDNIQISLIGVSRFFWEQDQYSAVAGTGPTMVNAPASSTVPGFAPRRSDSDTGLGSAGGDQVSLIAGGVEIARATEAVAANQFAIVPSGSSAVPELTGLTDSDTGFRWNGLNETIWIGGGSDAWNFSTAKFYSSFSNGPALINTVAQDDVPTLVPDHGDENTGIGHPGTGDQLSVIAGGVEGIRVTEAALAITVDVFGTLHVVNALNVDGVTTFIDDVAFKDGGDVEIFDGTNTFRTLLTTLLAPDTFRISGAGDLEFFDVSQFNTSMRLLGGISLDVDETGVVPGTPAAGSGQFWVRNDVPNVPMFTDDNGVDWVLNAAAVSPDPLLLSSGGVAVPSYSFSVDTDTGMWNPGADVLGFSIGGILGLSLTELNGGVIPAPDATQGITAFATGGQVSATQLDSGYNVITTVATTGDSVKLPPVFLIDSVIYVKNDGANDADVFPATGDDLGAGVDTAISLNAGSTVSFIATVADSTWTQLTLSASTTAIPDPLLLSAGSAAAPTYSFAGDPDTGVFNTGADILGLAAGGVEILRVVEAVGANQVIVSPGGPIDNPAAPMLAFGDGDTGFYENGDDLLRLAFAGVAQWAWTGSLLQGLAVDAPNITNAASSATVPNIRPNRSDGNTGLGSAGTDILSLIAGGVEMLRATETGVSATDQIFIPRDGAVATPALALGATNHGFYTAGVAQINVAVSGARKLFVNSSAFTGDGVSIGVALAAGPRMLNETPTGTNPTLLPNQSDTDTGIGWSSANHMSLIALGQEVVRVRTVTNNQLILVPNKAFQNAPGEPMLQFGNAANGFYMPVASNISLAFSGAQEFNWLAGQMQAPDGLVGAPAYSFLSDPDSGIRSSAADEVSVVAGGVEGIRVTEVGGAISVDVFGDMTVAHTAAEDDDVGVQINHDAAGFAGSTALGIDYIMGALASGEEEAVALINIDANLATGGTISGLEVLAAEPANADNVVGLFVGGGVEPILQLSGLFANADTVLDNAADVTVALSTGGAGNIGIFDADNDTVTVGLSTQFSAIEFILDTPASGAGIQPLFEFSTGVGTWAAFTPTDGTNQIRQSGVIAWLLSDIPSWATGTGGEFLIRITRQRNTLTTTPIADLVQILDANLYGWDENADLTINSVAIQDSTQADSITISNDGTDVNAVTVGITDINIGGTGGERLRLGEFNLAMLEKAAAPGDEAGVGQFWVRNDTPNTPMFTDDAGTDSVLNASGGISFESFQFFADQLENPVTADWTVNALAPAAADSNNSGLTVRLFDDTVEEGVGFIIEVPTGATNIVFDFVARAETAPGAVNTVGLDIYNRGIPDNAAVQAWSAATALTDISIPTNEFFQEDSQSVTLATLGVTAGETTQFELVRTLPGAGTDLTGDWALLLLKVSFT